MVKNYKTSQFAIKQVKKVLYQVYLNLHTSVIYDVT